MKNIVIFILIASYFFIVTLTLTAMANDPIVQYLSTGDNSTYIIDKNVTDVNISELPSKPNSAIGFLNMAVRLFAFEFPQNLLPSFLVASLRFFNWLLIIVLGVVMFRLASPFTGGN